MANYTRHEYLDCRCREPSHLIRATIDVREDPPEIVLTPILNARLPFLKRLFLGVKYIFLAKSFYFEDICLSDRGVDRISSLLIHRRILEKFRKRKRKEDLR